MNIVRFDCGATIFSVHRCYSQFFWSLYFFLCVSSSFQLMFWAWNFQCFKCHMCCVRSEVNVCRFSAKLLPLTTITKGRNGNLKHSLFSLLLQKWAKVKVSNHHDYSSFILNWQQFLENSILFNIFDNMIGPEFKCTVIVSMTSRTIIYYRFLDSRSPRGIQLMEIFMGSFLKEKSGTLNWKQ